MQDELTLTQQVEQLQAAYADFLTMTRAYPETLRTTHGACGEWSAKEVIAHLNGWFAEALRRYRAFGRGSGEMDYNIDAFNKVSVWQRRSLTYDEVVAELENRVQEFIETVQQLTPEQIERDERYAKWVNILLHEAQTHGAQLKTFQEENQ